MVSYASLPELKDRLSVTDVERDFALERCLDGASRWVDKETGRRFYVVSETRLYTAPRYSSWVPPSDVSERPGGGAQGFPIDDLIVPFDDEDEPIYPTLKTDEDGDRVHEVTWTFGTDWWLEPFNAALDARPYTRVERNQSSGRYFFPRERGAISVTGSFGWSAVAPGAIRELTLEVAELFARPVLDLTVAGVNTYKLGTELTVTMATEGISERSRQVVMSYRQGAI